MAEGSGAAPTPSSLKGLREQMVAAAQALAEERRNQSGASPVPVPSAVSIKSSTKPVIDGSILRSEERQRLARERREEREKQHAAKETQILEKEKKAKLQYEKQMEEKQRRLKEQKLKEQQKRAAVEEKRKQKIEEEKERYEAVVHRTLERSQRLETRQKRWSWGGSVTDSDAKPEASTGAEANKRSTSAANLKQAETVINKRLSSSAALLNSPSKGSTKRSASLNRLSNKVPLNSEQPVAKGLPVERKGETEKRRSSSLSRMSNKPQSSPESENVQKEEKAARRSQFSSLESPVISRLLAPTQASLARSKSAATLSADGKDPSASSSSISSPVHAPKVPVRSRSTDRLKVAAASPENASLESTQKSEAAAKPSSSSARRRAPSPSFPGPRRSPSPASVAKRPPSPATTRQKTHPSSPNALRQRPPSPATASKPAPIQRPALTPNVLSITKKRTEPEPKPKEKAAEAAGQEHGGPSEREVAGAGTKTKEDTSSSKGVPGTTTAEEAARILAEKRRLAREQREREDQEKAQREEEERVRKEEVAKRALEEQAQAEKALRELEEEKRLEEEQQQRLAEEERAQREQEEQEKLAELQLQREEAEAKALEESERQRQERERIMQRNMEERLERKKRIEEIMKRTRKSELNEAKNDDKSNEEDEDEDEEEEDLGLEKQDQPEKEKFEKLCQEDGAEVGHEFASWQEETDVRAGDIFLNGDQQEEVDPAEDDGNSLYFTQRIEASPPAKDAVVENSETVHVNEAEPSVGLVSTLNGKPPAWNFEEIIDLGLHPKTARLDAEILGADKPTQNFKDAPAVPAGPKLAFEEESAMNPLTKPLETPSEL